MASRQEFQNIMDSLREGRGAERVLTAEGRTWYRRFRPKERLILLGGGYIAQALCGLAADLDFSVSVADDRPAFAAPPRFPRAERVLCAGYAEAVDRLDIASEDYVAVLTRGHLFDADCLRAVLKRPFPRYVGVIGSQGRAAALLDQLAAEGFSRNLLDRVHTPIGLDIHALTVPEIAVSIAAELIAVRRSDLDRRSKSAILTDEGAVLPVLAFLSGGRDSGGTAPEGGGVSSGNALEDSGAGSGGTAWKDGSPGSGGTVRAGGGGFSGTVSEYGGAAGDRPDLPRAALTVCETIGSTPVKPGAMMAVDTLGNVSGTIGGGSGEGELISAALDLLRARTAEQETAPERKTTSEQEKVPEQETIPERKTVPGQGGERKSDGGKRLVSVTMYSGPTEDGMACGGSMRVLIEVVDS